MNQDIISRLNKLEDYLIKQSAEMKDAGFTHQLGLLMRQIEKMRQVVKPKITDTHEICTCSKG